jgi:bifunctional non-homologous end joining protein LigD
MASRRLSTYRAKRDFSRTAEPSGSGAVAPSPRLRFVVQRHAARRLHFDLRLELDGVFKSWAVTRGPSLDPGEKRLAVQVEDHPLEYGDFEGTIPQGQYGGGTVQIWDRGFWAPQVQGSAQQALAAGELKLVLAGERLRGGWVLVRLRNSRSGTRQSWLLIKHRDEFARADGDIALEEDRSAASGRTLEEIAAGRGRAPKPFMRRGRGAARLPSVWNSAAPAGAAGSRGAQSTVSMLGAAAPAQREARAQQARAAVMPQFIEPALCRLLPRPPPEAGWVHEIKLDGYRLQLRVEGGRAVLLTRKGLDWTERFASIARAAETLPDCILDGEAVALNKQGISDFSALQGALAQGRESALILFAFDLMFLSGRDLRSLPLSRRKEALAKLLRSLPPASRKRLRYLEHFDSAGTAVLESACRLSLEGVVSKRLDKPYESGRTGSWTKSKCRAGQEVVIGGWTSEGTHLSSLIAGVYRDGTLIPVGRIGTGFSGEKVRRLLPRLQRLASDESPFGERVPVPSGRTIHWLQPGLVAQIEFAGWTEGGSIRQAAFQGLREDKPAREIQAETAAPVERAQVKEPAAAKRRGSARRGRPAADGRASLLGVAISNSEKVLWPRAGDGRPVTKRELAEYLVSVGEWMLPHIAGRPCSLVRCPEGIGGPRFFQRHAMPGLSSLISLVRVRGDREPYVQVDRIEGLAALAQIAALELHPWNCVADQPEVPGRLVFDLDPAPDVGWEAVVGAARELRERLEALQLESFLKTSGGKGLHVVVPFTQPRKAALDWPLVKSFTRELCTRMAADSPERYVVNMAKRVRTGRIFLDYLRNDRTATAVAPLSPRAREGATVSMPLTWAQARTDLDPAKFTIRTARALLKRSAAWKEYPESARPLLPAIQSLAGGGHRARARGRVPSTGRPISSEGRAQ